MDNFFDYEKIKNKIYDYYCHTINSLSKKTNLSSGMLKNFFDPKKNHRYLKDVLILSKIAFALHIEVPELIS